MKLVKCGWSTFTHSKIATPCWLLVAIPQFHPFQKQESIAEYSLETIVLLLSIWWLPSKQRWALACKRWVSVYSVGNNLIPACFGWVGRAHNFNFVRTHVLKDPRVPMNIHQNVWSSFAILPRFYAGCGFDVIPLEFVAKVRGMLVNTLKWEDVTVMHWNCIVH